LRTFNIQTVLPTLWDECLGDPRRILPCGWADPLSSPFCRKECLPISTCSLSK
jgi:hypothetical protein